MELTKEEQIKIADFKEQYAVIRDNIKVANEELESVLFLVAQGNASLSELQEKIAQTEEYLKEQKRYIADLSEREEKLLEKEASLEFAREALVIGREALQKETIAAAASLAEVAEKRNETLISLDRASKLLGDLDAVINVKNVTIEEQDKVLNEKRAELESLENKIASAKLALEELEKKHADDVVAMRQYIEDETKRVREASNQLSLDTKELESKQRNFATLHARLQRVWEKLYPNQNLVI